MMVTTPVLFSIVFTVLFGTAWMTLRHQSMGPGAAIPWTIVVMLSGIGMIASYGITIGSWLGF